MNAQYLVAHAIIESGWGTSPLAQDRNNLFGYEAYTSDPNAAASFRSIPYDINFQAWFVRNDYLKPEGAFYNRANLDGMNVDYATATSWASSIARVMSEIATYTPTLANQPVLPESSVRPIFAYPTGAVGLTTVLTAVYANQPDSSQGTTQTLAIVSKGEKLSINGDCPGWDKVTTTAGVTGFVNWNDINLQNVLAVNGIAYGNFLNVRSTPTAATSSNIVDEMPNNVYLVLLGKDQNGWDHVTDANGKVGYVSSQYVRTLH